VFGGVSLKQKWEFHACESTIRAMIAARGMSPVVKVAGSEQILWTESAFFGVFPATVRGTNHLAYAHAPARSQSTHRLRPMIPAEIAAVGGHPPSAAQLAKRQDEDALGGATLVNVFDEGGERLIHARPVFAFMSAP
jgi:hypothetical protein